MAIFITATDVGVSIDGSHAHTKGLCLVWQILRCRVFYSPQCMPGSACREDSSSQKHLLHIMPDQSNNHRLPARTWGS